MHASLLVGEKGGRFPSSNCLLVKGNVKRVLVDAGCRRDQLYRVRDSIDAVVYTHLHPDHIRNHEILKGIPAYIPIYEANFPSLQDMARRYAPIRWREWITYVNVVFGLKDLPEAGSVYGGWETVKVGDVVIEAVPAYGHTRGHHLLLIGDYVHLSDIDLTGFGPWYGHPESSITETIADINLAGELEGKHYTTSHREHEYTRDQLNNALNKYMNSLCRQFLDTLNVLMTVQPSTPEKMINKGAIYKKKAPGAEAVMEYFEYEMIMKILGFLASKGIVSKNKRGYHVKKPISREECLEKILVSV